MPGHFIKAWEDKQRHDFWGFLGALSVVFVQAELTLQEEVILSTDCKIRLSTFKF